MTLTNKDTLSKKRRVVSVVLLLYNNDLDRDRRQTRNLSFLQTFLEAARNYLSCTYFPYCGYNATWTRRCC